MVRISVENKVSFNGGSGQDARGEEERGSENHSISRLNRLMISNDVRRSPPIVTTINSGLIFPCSPARPAPQQLPLSTAALCEPAVAGASTGRFVAGHRRNGSLPQLFGSATFFSHALSNPDALFRTFIILSSVLCTFCRAQATISISRL